MTLKYHFSILAVFVIALVALAEIDKNYLISLPHIVLPEKAHHTVGELPIIEHYDDGKLELMESEIARIKRESDRLRRDLERANRKKKGNGGYVYSGPQEVRSVPEQHFDKSYWGVGGAAFATGITVYIGG